MDAPALDACALRARLTGSQPEDGGVPHVAWQDVTPGGSQRNESPGGVPAAVLVPIVLGADPGVLLTRRAAHLSSHPGQVSFPGGRIDATDASPEGAALREAAEEIGLDPRFVELIGRLPDRMTGTGFRITPVLGLIQPGLDLRPSPHEVAALFVLPLAVLLDPAAPQRRRAEFRGTWREFWVWPHPEHCIWGATAAILVELADRLRGAPLRGE